MSKPNIQTISQACHTSINGIKEIIPVKIILRIQPFLFQLPPQRFCDVQMWRIWWKKENVQSSFLPVGHALLNGFCLVHTGIIQHHKRFLTCLKRKCFHIFQYKLSIDIAFSVFPPARVLPVYKTKTVEFICFFREDADFLIGKLPAVRNISFTAHMGFISIKQVCFTLYTHLLKFF